MISEKENTRISKFLSLVLRHQPATIGIVLDDQGWTEVAVLIDKMNSNGFKISDEILSYVVDTNAKKRFAFNDSKTLIRASQGHSVEVELGYSFQEPPRVLFHGTAERNITSILEKGLDKGSRHHVHLSQDMDTAIKVGMRHGKPVVLEVAAGLMHEKGLKFFVSDNNVWLTDYVPPGYLKIVNK